MPHINSFGCTAAGEKVQEIVLQNSQMEARILTFGATLRVLRVPDRSGAVRDVVLGYSDITGYETNGGYLGAVVGRYANRIAGACIESEGLSYALTANEGSNQLHGGPKALSHRVWTLKRATETEAVLQIVSPDGDNGFPGNLTVTVTYTLTEQGLRLHYEAVTDRRTPCCLTNHTYFNLNGEGTILQHQLQLEAEEYLPVDEQKIPLGAMTPVEGSPFDFTVSKTVGQDINVPDPQLQRCGGYDHNYVLRGDGFRRIAGVRGDKSGIELEVWTTLPGVQLYTGNRLHTSANTKAGQPYGAHGGLCLETQFFPDSPHHTVWGGWLEPGQKYDETTEYRFA